MKMAATSFRYLRWLTAIGAFSVSVFCDMAAPSPSKPKAMLVESQGYDWGYIAGCLVFAFVAALILVLIGRKLSKGSTK